MALDPFTRGRIVGHYESGWDNQRIANFIQVSLRDVEQVVAHFEATGIV
jgi:hypothetical protein